MGLHFGTTTDMIREFLFSLGGKKSFSDNRDFGTFHKFPRAVKRISLTEFFYKKYFSKIDFLRLRFSYVSNNVEQNGIGLKTTFFSPQPRYKDPGLSAFSIFTEKIDFLKMVFLDVSDDFESIETTFYEHDFLTPHTPGG